MHSQLRRPIHPAWFVSCLALLGIAVLFVSLADAQDAKKDDAKKLDAKKDAPKKEESKKDEPKKPDEMDLIKETTKTETDDGVEIALDYYPPPKAKGRNAPVVILAHAIGPGKQATSSRKDWDKFPIQLQKKGYAVVAFDFRGHGDSKKISEPKRYWNVPAAGLIGPHVPKRTFPANRPPATIDSRDYLTSLELAQLGNDLIAVKKWLHLKNNAQELNSSNVIVIGAEQGATLASLWIYNEFLARGRAAGKSEGDDISCVVWLSMQPFLANTGIERPTLEKCLEGMHDKFPTLMLFGENDKQRKDFATRALKWIKPKDPSDRFKGTGIIPVKGTSLLGAKLLGNEEFKTDQTIIDYIEKYKSDSLWREQKIVEQPTLFVTHNLGLR